MNESWQYLIGKYLDNSLSREELDLLLQKFEAEEEWDMLAKVMKEQWERLKRERPAFSPGAGDIPGADNILGAGDKDWDDSFRQMMETANRATFSSLQAIPETPVKKTNRRLLWLRPAAAAAVITAVVTLLLPAKKHKEDTGNRLSGLPHKKMDMPPGRNRAVLQLSDGTSIDLDSAKNGELASQGSIKVIKLGDGRLAYKGGKGTAGESQYNTMSTPKGGQYELVLPDGTKVWLNAASSIKYPVSFTGKERIVEVTGEVYFEVAKNMSAPFKVNINKSSVRGGEIEVLGTRFNVNAYGDEPDINTTLLDGAIKVAKEGVSGLLKPGQQARIDSRQAIRINNEADLGEVIAWKEGLFNFNNTDLRTIMRQISRWYDIEVAYEGNIPEREFSGKITRNTNLSNVLQILEQSNVHFRAEGKKIIVLP